MVRSKLGLKVLGLCAMLVGMMALASVAQAEPNAFWLVNGAKFTTLLPSLVAEAETEGILLTELGEKKIHLKCPEILLKEAHLVEPLAQILGRATFHKCKFFRLEGASLIEVGACTPEAEGSKGLINSNLVKGLIKLHEGQGTVLLLPAEAEAPFATINLGEECAFGENITVEGKWVIEDANGQFLTDLKEHLVRENVALSKLTVNGGAKVATIDGNAWVKLGGEHATDTFAGHPG